MWKILKFDLAVLEKQTIELPIGARIIRVGDVEGKFYLWAMCRMPVYGDTWDRCELETRFLECYKTGMPIIDSPDDLVYLGELKMFVMQELCLYTFERVK